MIRPQSISTYISRLAISLLVLCMGGSAKAQSKLFAIEKDTIPLFRGIALSVDLVEPAMLMLGDMGGYEGALRVNLHDQYYPVFEMGYGKADHTDEVTEIHYKTAAPYFRIGCDLNILKKKHAGNRFYIGLRYAFSMFDVDISRKTFQDPVWGWDTGFSVSNESCNQHWAEVVIGLDTKVAGPIHLGWNVRYKRRISHKDTSAGEAWYVPGFGENGDSSIGANFNVIIDI